MRGNNPIDAANITGTTSMGDVPSRPGLTGLPFPGLESFPGMERNCVLSQNKKSGKIFNTQEIFIKAKREKCEGWDSNPRTPTRLGPQPSAFDLAWLPSLLCHNKDVVYLIKRFDPSAGLLQIL